MKSKTARLEVDLEGKLVAYWGEGADTGRRYGIVRRQEGRRPRFVTVQRLGGDRAVTGSTYSARYRGAKKRVPIERVIAVRTRKGQPLRTLAELAQRKDSKR